VGPSCGHALLFDPGGVRRQAITAPRLLPSVRLRTSAPTTIFDFGAPSHGLPARCLRFAWYIAAPRRKTRFRLEATLGRAGLVTSRVPSRSFRFLDLPLLPGFAWRTDQNQCTPPPAPAPMPAGWNESAAFRETTLHHFTEPGHAEAIRAFGVLLHDMALECAPVWPTKQGDGTAVELRAAAADLRHLQGCLAHAGSDRYVSSLSPEETRLAELAEKLAAEVARIAETIEQALG
jgi:hypothetical protein